MCLSSTTSSPGRTLQPARIARLFCGRTQKGWLKVRLRRRGRCLEMLRKGEEVMAVGGAPWGRCSRRQLSRCRDVRVLDRGQLTHFYRTTSKTNKLLAFFIYDRTCSKGIRLQDRCITANCHYLGKREKPSLVTSSAHSCRVRATRPPHLLLTLSMTDTDSCSLAGKLLRLGLPLAVSFTKPRSVRLLVWGPR